MYEGAADLWTSMMGSSQESGTVEHLDFFLKQEAKNVESSRTFSHVQLGPFQIDPRTKNC